MKLPTCGNNSNHFALSARSRLLKMSHLVRTVCRTPAKLVQKIYPYNFFILK